MCSTAKQPMFSKGVQFAIPLNWGGLGLSNVQFFFSETRLIQQVSSLRLWDSRFDNSLEGLARFTGAVHRW